ncbi:MULTISPECIES: response regulator transcription factor [Dyadobacter]|jgi:two-component system invasion response regulator UvrY|uniref:Response regulator transcription factor n=1 Tax=Dyadobacter chenhuakuii TaxID=2909339 RepID=A0A9X1TSQ3_9BACT|nr:MULTISPECIES: response regulator transcription factor [Dyadobacter]MCE7070080.1 response regulator transcription factor [Dyadobacter sp. CY327]MCF2492409.1 response regulator transcription factor [Dyadobacter chenhuakuii]MCF2497167.1 response regulator transcription factor [Dyadobacter chenhuakuii]MCF2517065.1 response regulator transcription factor [Dyadobacter sp. CY351]USJ33289.1 response regulator transcription factor [Dyadobacter chenhuakuii]
MSIQIIVAEDHPLILMGIQHLLMEHMPGAVVTATGDFNKALALLEKQPYNLLIMDINLPGGDKVGMITSVRMKQPKIPILVCSSYDEQLYALPFLKAGANGYISKTALNEEFKQAIDSVISGKIYASPSVMEQVFGQLFNKGSQDLITDKLTDKELEVAKLLSKGLSTKAISEHIHLSPSSVSSYKAKIFEKLGVTNVIELTRYFELNG